MAIASTDSDTLKLIKLIGSPFAGTPASWRPAKEDDLHILYDLAFENRVELLYLQALERYGLLQGFESKKMEMEKRCTTTRKIAAETSSFLAKAGVRHAVFKSIKPYPATPNDTDIVCLGNEEEYQKGLRALTDAGYGIQGRAPMQTLMYHPTGEGKVDKKKKGGTYYVDLYRGVAVDFYEYVNKKSLEDHVINRVVEGIDTVLLSAEPELAIVMFHNVFPEKTFHLEHFYLCLYGMVNPDFNLDKFVEYTERNAMTRAVLCNLTVIEILHKEAFGNVPEKITFLLERWGREISVADSLRKNGYHTTFIFSALVFWSVFFSKFGDPFSRRSILRQCSHMLNPIFFWDVLTSAWRRTFGKDIYQHK